MPKTALSSARSYQKLLKSINETVFESRHKIERTFVSMYWNIGKAITGYTAHHDRRLTDGLTIYEQLSKDLSMDQRTLYQAAGFYKAYPRLDDKLPLSWSHYRYLSQIKSTSERQRWQARALREHLSVKDLLMLSKQSAELKKKSGKILSEERGKLYHYRAVKIGAQCYLDIGFDNYIKAPLATKTLSNKRVYHSHKEEGYQLYLSDARKQELYTYAGEIEKIVDADTLIVKADCGFGVFHRERVRLRGINAPEKSTMAGKRAALAVKKYLEQLKFVIVKTYKEDKYGRYLADVFYLPQGKDPQRVAAQGVLLNQQLLDEGLAEEYKE